MAFKLSDEDLRAAKAAAAIRQANQAQLDYNAAEQALADAQNNVKKGFDLGQTLGEIGKSITSGAKGLWDSVAGGVNEIGAGIQNTIWGNNIRNTMKDNSAKRNEIAKKYGYASYADASNDENASQDFWNEIKDISQKTSDTLNKLKDENVNSATYKNLKEMKQNKYAANALRGGNFLADVLLAATGVGGIANAAINGVQGGIGGLADQLEAADGLVFDPLGGNYNSGGLDAGEVAKSMAAGAAGGLAGSAVGGGLGKIGGGNALGKVVGSNVGRGALSGAASSAVSAGTQTALDGGSLEDVLSNAASAGGKGALFGGIISGGMGLANKGFNKISDKINNETTPNTLRANKINKKLVAQTDDTSVEKATGWGEKDMTGSVKKKNALQKIGSTLKDTGQKTQDSAILGKLKGNLADEMAAKNSVQRLREIGFEPSDYEQAANLSEVANKWYADQVKKSKVTLDMPDTYKIADETSYIRQLDADQAINLKSDITKRLDAVRKVGGGLATFDAEGLERVARDLGNDAEKMTTTNYGGSKKRINNLDSKTEAYANALRDVQAQLRSKVDDMTDYDPKSLRKVLKNAGATDGQIDYLTDAKSMAQVKRNTSLLEDARNMYRQAKSSPFKRGANADNSISVPRQVVNASGAGGLLNTVLEPVGKVVGKVEKGMGKVIGGAGDIIAGKMPNIDIPEGINNAATRFANSAINTDNVANSQAGNFISALTNATQRGAIRQNALNEAENASQNIENQRVLDNAMADYQLAQTNYDNAIVQAQQLAAQSSQPDTLNTIKDAMSRALAAGDIDSYSKLASLYKQAYEIYGGDTSATSGLNATQQNNLAKLEAAGTAIDQLEALYNQAGGGQGRLGGKIAELGASLGLNSDASAYNNAARGLINQISAAVGKTDSLNTEGEVQRALDLVPTITDTPQEAQIKLESLRKMLNSNKQTYQNIYGVNI